MRDATIRGRTLRGEGCVQYLPDPQRVIAVLAGQLNATGQLSVIASNAAADPLRAAVRNLALEEAFAVAGCTDSGRRPRIRDQNHPYRS